MEIIVPGRAALDLRYAVFDYNGTLAVGGKLLPGVAESLHRLAGQVEVQVITADTFGSVEKELAGLQCRVIRLGAEAQSESKRDHVIAIGAEYTLAVGNGANDRLMLREAALSIAIVEGEGAFVQSLLAADIVCTSVHDVFGLLFSPDRLRATLRS